MSQSVDMPEERAINGGQCAACGNDIPKRYFRACCPSCGQGIPQTPQLAEIERLTDALVEIDDVAGFDYATMPEAGRAKAHELVLKIVRRALDRTERNQESNT